MRVLFDIEHPAQVHFFKNTIWNLQKKGHQTKIIAKDKEITTQLLDRLGFEYTIVSKWYPNLYMKAYGVIDKDLRLYKIAREFKPDILTGLLTPHIAHVGKLIRKPSITFNDTEGVKFGRLLTIPFTDAVCTPSCFREEYGSKHVRFNGYKELAYLHPNYFKPDASVLDSLGIPKGEPIIILRFISWSASHDVGLSGIKNDSALELVKKLEKYGRVFITSERKLSSDFEKYRINLPQEKIHSLMYYAQLYIGEGGTMATEAAILGTPSIHIESDSKGKATGYMYGNSLDLHDTYKLLYFYPDQKQALDKAVEILENKNSKTEWQNKREKLLNEKIDVTAWMTDFIERYPNSFEECKKLKAQTKK
jgi:predicted glycosyltransferase